MAVIKIIVALLIFSLIIVIHELGHFLLAKKNGIGVTEFSVGMGPRLVSFVKNNTRYSIKLLPLGGSCMMVGEDEIVDREDSFNNKSVFARISVVAAGPIFNFILAFVLALFVIGIMGADKPYVTKMAVHSPGYAAGIRQGDTITSINGHHISIGREVSSLLLFEPYDGSEVDIEVLRDGEEKSFKVTPEFSVADILNFKVAGMEDKKDVPDTPGALITALNEKSAIEEGLLKEGDILTAIGETKIESSEDFVEYLKEGYYTSSDIELEIVRNGQEKKITVTPDKNKLRYYVGFAVNIGYDRVNAIETIKYSAIEVKYWIVTTLKSLGMIFKGKVSRNDVAGPVGIMNIIGDSYEAGVSGGAKILFSNLAGISILLTANLGVMNLLPIPALDGGRLVFLFIEVIRRKRCDQKIEGMVHLIGLVALLVLMMFIMANDISNIFK